ncbi:hypothetical protein LEP1GSC071_0074, partial [Leptospira santarosai str. JET]
MNTTWTFLFSVGFVLPNTREAFGTKFFFNIYTVFLFCELYHLLLKIDLHLLLTDHT